MWFYTMPDGLFVMLGMLFFVIPFTGYMARKEIKAFWEAASDPSYQPPSFLDMMSRY